MKQAKRDLSHLLKLYEEGAVKPNVIERIPLSKVARAQVAIETKSIHGFLICEPWIKGGRISI
jgi:D-arabinose 1-dehydrogenase-like Zn-dependent alcohol dehydrogenase